MAGEPCKPESSSTSVFSITSVESINAICQRSQFRQQKQVLCHSYGTVFFACTLPRFSTESAFFSQVDYFRVASTGSNRDHFLQADFRVRTFSGRALAEVCESAVQLASLPAKWKAANERGSACLLIISTHRDIRTGRAASYRTVRVTPPNIHSRSVE
jgi:hypothetical protein